jgi:hypothetical protein
MAKSKARITTRKSPKDGQFYNRLRAGGNNKILMSSEGFKTKRAAEENEKKVVDACLEIAGVLGRGR